MVTLEALSFKCYTVLSTNMPRHMYSILSVPSPAGHGTVNVMGYADVA
jgi:hypothetical protein